MWYPQEVTLLPRMERRGGKKPLLVYGSSDTLWSKCSRFPYPRDRKWSLSVSSVHFSPWFSIALDFTLEISPFHHSPWMSLKRDIEQISWSASWWTSFNTHDSHILLCRQEATLPVQLSEFLCILFQSMFLKSPAKFFHKVLLSLLNF